MTLDEARDEYARVHGPCARCGHAAGAHRDDDGTCKVSGCVACASAPVAWSHVPAPADCPRCGGRYTFGHMLDTYAQLVRSGHADTDLTPAQRNVVARLLVAVESPAILVGDYLAPFYLYSTNDERAHDEMARELGRALSRVMFTPPELGMTYAEWDAAVARTAEIIRNV